MLYIIGYTIFGIAQQIGSVVLTNEPKQRMRQSGWKQIFTQLFSVGITSYMSMVLAAKYGGLKIEAFQELCILAVVAGAVLNLISIIAVSPYDKPENFTSTTGGKIKIMDCFKLIKSNRAIWAYVAAATSDKIALQASSQAAVTTMVFGIVIGNYQFNGSLSMITLVPCILILMFASRLRGKGDAKTVLIKWSIAAIAISAATALFMFVSDPAKISVTPFNTAIFLVLFCLLASCKVVTGTCTSAMIPDLVDYELYRSGNYMPGTVAAILSFVDKMISSFAATIVAFCIAAIGYKTAMPQPTDQNTPMIFWMAMFLWVGLPIIGWIFTLVVMPFYPLNGEMMQKIQQSNREKRLQTV
jgi:Na+/melibiose symporter-like transporter